MKLNTIPCVLLLASICGISACATAPATTSVAGDRPEPVIADNALNCSSLMTAPGDIAARPSVPYGWVLVQYSLDGSGKAQQVEVLDSYLAKEVSKDIVKLVRTASYRKGEVRARCQGVISFRTTRV